MTNHAKQLAKSCLLEAKAQYGRGWEHLSHEQQRGAVALRALSIVFANQSSTSADAIGYCADVARAALALLEA